MKTINVLLMIAGLSLAACAQSGVPQELSGPLNGSNDTECRHVGAQGTGYVVNCNRRNDTGGNEREIFH